MIRLPPANRLIRAVRNSILRQWSRALATPGVASSLGEHPFLIMSFIEAAILGLVQGLTEFLPIS